MDVTFKDSEDHLNLNVDIGPSVGPIDSKIIQSIIHVMEINFIHPKSAIGKITVKFMENAVDTNEMLNILINMTSLLHQHEFNMKRLALNKTPNTIIPRKDESS